VTARVSRRQWAELRFAHPGVDPTDPTDEFAVELLNLADEDPDVWETGSEADALHAYERALRVALPDYTWASEALDEDENLAVEVSVCNELGISHDAFLDWPARSQDLAIAAAIRSRNTCHAGHPREAMTDPSLMQIKREHCATCARAEEFEDHIRAQSETAGPDFTRGWHTEVTRVPR